MPENNNNRAPIDKILANIKHAIENKSPILPNDEDIIELTNIISDNNEAMINNKTAIDVSEYVKILTAKTAKLNSGNKILSDDEMKEVFKEVLKPYLRSWLNNNLTKIVKEVVEKEIKLLLTKTS
jgi:uncharacterized protein